MTLRDILSLGVTGGTVSLSPLAGEYFIYCWIFCFFSSRRKV